MAKSPDEAKPAKKRGPGKPAFEPTAQQRKTVKTMSSHGVPQDDIAYALEIDPKTLRKHFPRELRMGMIDAKLKVGQSLFTMATTGKNVAAAIFYAKARMGWSEKVKIEHTGPGGGPMQSVTKTVTAKDMEDLSDDALARLYATEVAGSSEAESQGEPPTG
jgi:hypothetical protein